MLLHPLETTTKFDATQVHMASCCRISCITQACPCVGLNCMTKRRSIINARYMPCVLDGALSSLDPPTPRSQRHRCPAQEVCPRHCRCRPHHWLLSWPLHNIETTEQVKKVQTAWNMHVELSHHRPYVARMLLVAGRCNAWHNADWMNKCMYRSSLVYSTLRNWCCLSWLLLCVLGFRIRVTAHTPFFVSWMRIASGLVFEPILDVAPWSLRAVP